MAMSTPSQTAPAPSQPPPSGPPPPDDLPPSYEDATHSSSSPLLVGPPPNYGAVHALPESDRSSLASSEAEDTSRALLPEWIGQLLVVLCFLAILYGFYRLVEDPHGFLG